MDAISRGRHLWHQLPARSGDDGAISAASTGVARGQKTNDEARPLASMDIKTVLDVAGPKHRAKIEEDHDVHGRIIAALLRGKWLVWKDGATLESVESYFSCARCIRQRSVEAPWLWLNMAMQGEERDGRPQGSL